MGFVSSVPPEQLIQLAPIHSHPPIIPVILQLSKPDFYPVGHKIKLEREFTLKEQDPEASKEASISSSVHDLCI